MSPPASDDSPPVDDSSSADAPPSADGRMRTDRATTDRASGVGGLLPRATVESRWWYWIAVVPVYFAVSLVLGGLLFAAVVLGFWVGVGFTVSGLALFAFAAVVFGLPGLLLSVLFPVAMYVDARAVSESGADWHPDPALYGLVALAGVLVTAFTVSVPLALYYLYRRHETVGVP